MDHVDVIGLEIEDIPTTGRFGRANNVCHDISSSDDHERLILQITNVKLDLLCSSLFLRVVFHILICMRKTRIRTPYPW